MKYNFTLLINFNFNYFKFSGEVMIWLCMIIIKKIKKIKLKKNKDNKFKKVLI
jgi:hypothetical protein